MALADEISASSPSHKLNKINIHTKLNTTHNEIVGRPKFCKTCCKPCRRICPRALARLNVINEAQLKAWKKHERNGNFVLISAKYITELYRWTNECLFTDDFLQSIVASVILFAIGIKLTRELNAWNLSRAVIR